MQRSNDLTTQAAGKLGRTQIEITDLSQIRTLQQQKQQQKQQREAQQCVSKGKKEKERLMRIVIVCLYIRPLTY